MLSTEHINLRIFPCTRAGLARAATLAAIVSFASTAQAEHPSTPHPFTSASIEWSPGGSGRPAAASIFVGHDGERYTHLVGDVETRFKLKARVKSGHRIYGWTITTGDPTVTSQLPLDVQGAKDGTYEKSVDTHANFRMNAVTMVNTGIPGIGFNREQDVIDRCNNAFSNLPAENRSGGQMEFTVHAGFSAGAWKGSQFVSWTGWYPAGASSRPAIAHTTFPVNVVCLSHTDPRSADLTPTPPNVDIRVKQVGETCPRQVEVSAFIDYERKTEARFHFLHNGKASEEIVIQPRKVTLGNKSWWRVERLQRYRVDPGQHRFRVAVVDGPKSKVETIRVDCGPLKVHSVWLSYEVENVSACPKRVVETVNFTANRPGNIPYEIKHQGGLVVYNGTVKAKREDDRYKAVATRSFEISAFEAQLMAQVKNDPAGNSGWTWLKVECLNVLGGQISFRDKGSRCPREASIGVSLRADRSGKIPYQLDCTGGRSWTGDATAHQTGNDTFIAAAVLPLAIEKNEQLNCALKTRSKGKPKIVDLRGHKYNCITPSVQTGSSDLVSPPRPTHSVDTAPPVRVVDPPRPTPGVDTAPPVRVVDPPRIRCVGGEQRGKRCVCARNEHRVKLGARAWRCVKKPVQIVCKGGQIRGQRCLCGARTKKVSIGRNAWQCKKQVTPLRCIGGKARGRRCVCPRRMTVKRVGQSVFRCVRKPTVQRDCPRGKVRVRGRCIRPAG
ncbi:MAG: hypothetical protein ACFCUR_02760 [Rhodomicrobiaceae bacterium]